MTTDYPEELTALFASSDRIAIRILLPRHRHKWFATSKAGRECLGSSLKGTVRFINSLGLSKIAALVIDGEINNTVWRTSILRNFIRSKSLLPVYHNQIRVTSNIPQRISSCVDLGGSQTDIDARILHDIKILVCSA